MSEPYRIALTGAQTIAVIAATRETVLSALAAHDAVEIDCAEIVEADLSLLQVLLAARASARRRGKRLRLNDALAGGLGAVLDDAGYAPRPGQPGETTFWLGETD